MSIKAPLLKVFLYLKEKKNGPLISILITIIVYDEYQL